jgi:hypothetical protein
MFCSKCGFKLQEDSIFCTKCGEKIHQEIEGSSENHLDSSTYINENTENVHNEVATSNEMPSNIQQPVPKVNSNKSFLVWTIGIAVVVIVGLFLGNYTKSNQVNTIEFSASRDDNGVLGELTNEFGAGDDLHLSFYFPDGKGGEYSIVIEEKTADGGFRMYHSYDGKVPPDWEGVTTSSVAPFETGEYVMKIVKGEEIVAKGSFKVKE